MVTVSSSVVACDLAPIPIASIRMCHARFSAKELVALVKAMSDEGKKMHNDIHDTMLANAHAMLRRDEAFREMRRKSQQSVPRDSMTEDMMTSLIRSMGYGRSNQ